MGIEPTIAGLKARCRLRIAFATCPRSAMDSAGLEPAASHLRSEGSTTELRAREDDSAEGIRACPLWDSGVGSGACDSHLPERLEPNSYLVSAGEAHSGSTI